MGVEAGDDAEDSAGIVVRLPRSIEDTKAIRSLKRAFRRCSLDLRHCELLSMDPLPHVRRTIPEHGPVGLGACQQEHTGSVDNAGLAQIKNETLIPFGSDERLQLGAVPACNLSAEGQHYDIAVTCALYSKRHRGGSGRRNA